MWSLVFFVFLLCEKLINFGQGQDYKYEPNEIIAEEYTNSDTLKYPLNHEFISGNNPLKLTSVWGCDKYSAAVYAVTKRAITFANDITIYLRSSKNDSDESPKTSSPIPLDKPKLNILYAGVDMYKDLLVLVQLLWLDFKNAISKLGKQLSNELELQISRLPLARV